MWKNLGVALLSSTCYCMISSLEKGVATLCPYKAAEYQPDYILVVLRLNGKLECGSAQPSLLYLNTLYSFEIRSGNALKIWAAFGV